MPDTDRETKRVLFTRSTDVVIPGRPADPVTGDPGEPATFEQEATDDWADIVRRPSGAEIRKYIALYERVAGTRNRYELATGLIQIFTVDWSLTDAAGNKLTFDERGQDKADGDYLKQLAEAIWAIVGPRLPKL